MPPLTIAPQWIDDVRASMPELPATMAERFQRDDGLTADDAAVMTQSLAFARYYEAARAACGQPKLVANWLMGEVSRRLNAEGRPIECGEPKRYLPTTFIPRSRPALVVDKVAVEAAIHDSRTVTMNTLAPQSYQGLGPSPYRRPGRVPGSVNVPATSLVDPTTGRFVSPADALARFDAAGVTPDRRVIAYCGAGISATIDLFLLHQLGFDDLTLYDGSMSEWAEDSSLPIETD